MIFTEFRFLFFFLIVFSTHWILRENRYRKLWLLLCSYLFYGAWDWRFLSLIWISTVVDYIVGLQLDKTTNGDRRKIWLLVSLGTNLGILGFFKYFNFFVDSAANFLNFLGFSADFTTLNIILPVGISFYTFQTLSYSIDIYYKKMKPVYKLLDFALFVSFFPQLVAGPIVRASTFLPQLEKTRVFSRVRVKSCLLLFLIGFVKKACISDRLSPIVDSFFAAPETYTAGSSWVGVLFYAVQIYCDFSGYTDMAIACAGLLEYELCLNFNFPYLSENITEFWRRWHISLSTWLRDYLYIPLGGNRGGQLMTYRNLMLTMLLGGLWHGAGWNFVIWGGLHGGALIVQREWSKFSAPYRQLSGVMKSMGPPLTFYWVCIAWIFFRATDLEKSMTILQSFVFFNSSGSNELGTHLLGIFIVLAIVHFAAQRNFLGEWWEKTPDWIFAAWYGLAVSVAFWFVAPNYSAFIYFQF
ncbi:MBOAT family O-acyltransferase [Lyngbya sp. CCY1209]|uniref:MBOAT family O-acyltransferase n=1 Tax=Lyngbya sp. CCY1209 TaxID=2886103 RepID=UPI002D200054|nr:MBOAT family O-acyltransferase [Lyngbya sp. CCY1209]MEB3883315.1 MBOAT family protein [Lyngbya sp. CCY1209]